MARMAVLAGFLLLSFISSLVPVEGDFEDAFVVVYKKANIKRLKDGEEITISYRIDNAGGSTAYDVSMTDSEWPTDIFDVEGNITKTWDKLEAGGAPLTHSLLLRPKKQGPFTSPPAVVKYRVASKAGDMQTAYSTPLPELDVLSDKPQESQYLWLKELAVKFGPLATCICIVAMIVIVVTTPTKPARKSARGSKKRR